jgi:hypothetical protein
MSKLINFGGTGHDLSRIAGPQKLDLQTNSGVILKFKVNECDYESRDTKRERRKLD